MAYDITATNGNDLLNRLGEVGPGTIVGLAGDDTIFGGRGFIFASGGSGNDRLFVGAENTGTVDGGSGDDFIASDGNNASMVLLGGDGADEFEVINTTAPQTILGGNDSNDGADIIVAGGLGADLVFGNGGNDTSLRTAVTIR
jgi:Ca2+-binding RTX toxin-like protein